MGEPRTLYAIPLRNLGTHPGERVADWCWGTCGRAFVGGLVLENLGEAIPCGVPAAECPHFDSETGGEPMWFGTDGEPIHLRKLKEAAHG